MTHKSDVLVKVAEDNGWKVGVVTDIKKFNETNNVTDVTWNLYALRDKETLHVVYQGNRLTGGLYKYGAHSVKLWWKNEVVKLLTGKPDPAKYRASGENPPGDEPERSVPWGEDTPAIDILLEVARKEIRWIRKFDNSVRSAVVDVNLNEKGSARHFRIFDSKSGRVLEWADALGFHAVALNQIIEVN